MANAIPAIIAGSDLRCSDAGFRLPREACTIDVEGALATLKESLAGTDLDAIKAATEKLLTASQSFSQRLYEEAAKSNVNEPAAPAGDDDDIVDAEIVDE